MPNDAGLCSAFELKRFWQLELLTFTLEPVNTFNDHASAVNWMNSRS